MTTFAREGATGMLANTPLPITEGARAGGEWSVVVATDRATLEQHVEAWRDLAADALEPNAFYEPWVLLPAVESFGEGKELLFVFVYRRTPTPNAAPTLCGFLPLERSRSFRGLPVGYLSLWDFGHCFLSTPLVRKGQARECLAVFLEWLATDRESRPVIEFPRLAGEGPVYQHLVDEFRRRGNLVFVEGISTRAFLRRRDDADAYLQAALSANKRRDLQRKQRRLDELGRVEYVTLSRAEDLEPWLDAFLRLEAAGWKGQGGTALACREADRSFFLKVAREGFARGRLIFLGLFLDGRPIALRCSFASPPGSFFFKPVYDEDYGRYSPGVLLEIETVRQVHTHPEVQWMDSCTSPDNELFNSLWLDRRIIQTVVAATGRRGGRLALSALPLLRWLKGKLRR